jgi:hypothetical protein
MLDSILVNGDKRLKTECKLLYSPSITFRQKSVSLQVIGRLSSHPPIFNKQSQEITCYYLIMSSITSF